MEICNININVYDKESLFKNFTDFKQVITVNAESVVRSQDDRRLKNIINNNWSTIDGEITLWLYKLKYRDSKINKISGADFIYDACDWASKNNKKVFLLGGKEISNEISVRKLKEKYNTEIQGYSPKYEAYPFSKETNNKILEKIKQYQPDILFVSIR